MIVKAQRSQFTTAPTPRMLFYDYNGRHTYEGALTPDWKIQFDEYGERFFAEVKWEEQAPPEFLDVVPEQGW